MERDGRADGYPQESSPIGGSGGIADPTFEAVAQRQTRQRNPAHKALREFRKALLEVSRQTLIAESQAKLAEPPPTLGAGDDPDTVWCKSCLRVNEFNPIFGKDLCRWCYGWAATHASVWPPGGLLKLKKSKGRLTSADVEPWENRPGPRPKDAVYVSDLRI